MGQFDWISQLPEMYQAGRNMRVASDTRSAFQGGLPRTADGMVDYGAAVNMAARSGNIELVQKLAPLADAQRRDARDFAFRQEEARRAQGNVDRSYGLQEKQALYGMQEKPAIHSVKDAAGNEQLVRVSPSGQAMKIDTGIDSTAQNPFSYPGKMTESQSKDALYADRMMNAEKVFSVPETVEAAQSTTQRALGMLPGAGTLYNLNSEDYQKFDQAQRDFINATLRRESGAVINENEFANARRQYFPTPGDTPAVIQQKRQNRLSAIRGIAAGAGPSFVPASIIDEGGNLVPNPRKSQPKAQGGNIDVNASLAAARAAIASGKDRNAVIERLRQNGIDPAGL